MRGIPMRISPNAPGASRLQRCSNRIQARVIFPSGPYASSRTSNAPEEWYGHVSAKDP